MLSMGLIISAVPNIIMDSHLHFYPGMEIGSAVATILAKVLGWDCCCIII